MENGVAVTVGLVIAQYYRPGVRLLGLLLIIVLVMLIIYLFKRISR